ncbi:MAG: hypothetical protein VB070_04915 [Clostridiaceae bacterium]|nr:hypothetical protein [Clostridiaceae bacterium]
MILIMLPIGITGLRQIHQWVLVQRSHQYVQEILASAVHGLSPSDLSEGKAKFMTMTTRNSLRNQFNENMPPMLAGRLSLKSISFKIKRLQSDEHHWLGKNQPLIQPIIVCQAELSDYQDGVITICHSLEYVLQ